MQQTQIHLKLAGGKFAFVYIHPSPFEKRDDILRELREELPVFMYDFSERHYKISLYYFDEFTRICDCQDWEVFATDKLLKVVDYIDMKRKNKDSKKEIENFHSDLWVENDKLSILSKQAKAANFLQYWNGGLIGDEMGVGKTIQSIAVMVKKLEEDPNTKILIVVKGELRMQWRTEILKFTKISFDDITVVGDRSTYKCPIGKIAEGEINFLVANGCKQCKYADECKKAVSSGNEIRKTQIKSSQIAIMSYDALRINCKEISEQGYELAIFDESTAIKNKESLVAKAAIKFKKENPSIDVIMLSGTFVENRLLEFYVPLYIYDPALVGTIKNFKNQYIVTDYWGGVVRYKRLKKFKERIKPFFLRRTLDEVWDEMPHIDERNIYCDMEKYQKDIYEKAEKGVLQDLKNLELTDKINYAGVLALIIYLLQIACTVEVIDDRKKGGKASAKINYLLNLLNDEIVDNQLIVFCTYANKVIPFINKALKSNGYTTGVVTGKTKKNNEETLRKFKNGDFQILLASDTIAHGKNLQFVRYLVNFNIPWNPALLDQRIHRIFRKGQEHNVVIANLITKNSVDEKVMDRVLEKRELFDIVLGYGEYRKIQKPSINEMMSMLK